jgi:Domain of unknown function (DUF397)
MDLSHVTWRKASYSGSDGGNCVEVGVWGKASYTGTRGGNCVEVTAVPANALAVRDSKDPDGPKLVLTPAIWRAFTREIKNGGFDLA